MCEALGSIPAPKKKRQKNPPYLSFPTISNLYEIRLFSYASTKPTNRNQLSAEAHIIQLSQTLKIFAKIWK
jgi:hypothetical protein